MGGKCSPGGKFEAPKAPLGRKREGRRKTGRERKERGKRSGGREEEEKREGGGGRKEGSKGRGSKNYSNLPTNFLDEFPSILAFGARKEKRN